jgi:hypothetical protein
MWAEPISSAFFFGIVGPWPVTGPITSAFLAFCFFVGLFFSALLGLGLLLAQLLRPF